MPNYCNHNLTVSGDEKELKRFKEAITAEHLRPHDEFRILDNLLPSPPDTKSLEWNIENYGSKWADFDGMFGEVTDTEINLSFASAWSPIGVGICTVSYQFPVLDFVLTYQEGGMAFCGGYAIRNGEFLADIEGEYPSMTAEQLENEAYDEFYDQVDTVLDKIATQCKEVLTKQSNKGAK